MKSSRWSPTKSSTLGLPGRRRLRRVWCQRAMRIRGALLGVIADASVADSDIDAFIAAHSSAPAEAEARPLPSEPARNRPCKPAMPMTRPLPSVRRLADELGVTGHRHRTGRRGRITDEDVKVPREE
ncbi:MAG: hypothetical protein CM15mP74_35720 [Halieaceae bacterium]|nr:MAG: hypothetical protein CM15mP74_35720 [Halieaceae bacterium]